MHFFLFFWIFLRFSYSSHLSHIIIPFHVKQINAVIYNVKTWSNYTACNNFFSVNLIFYVSGIKNTALDLELISPINKTCFSSIRIEYVDLPEKVENHLDGAKYMFEKILSRSFNYGVAKISHVFLMEPDCKPIRKFWLNAINNQIIAPNNHFWMKGSIFRGHAGIKKNLFDRIHINGNAIYNLENDEFRDFYFNIVRPFMLKHYRNNMGGYDVHFFKLLLWNNGSNFTEYYHKFQFSDFIQNHWHSKIVLNDLIRRYPNTFLIHGGIF